MVPIIILIFNDMDSLSNVFINDLPAGNDGTYRGAVTAFHQRAAWWAYGENHCNGYLGRVRSTANA